MQHLDIDVQPGAFRRVPLAAASELWIIHGSSAAVSKR
jgi:hypothetical protein